MYKLKLFFILMGLVSISSCAVGSGCPAEKADTVKYTRQGQIKGKTGKTQLFPKNMRK